MDSLVKFPKTPYCRPDPPCCWSPNRKPAYVNSGNQRTLRQFGVSGVPFDVNLEFLEFFLSINKASRRDFFSRDRIDSEARGV